MNRIEWSESVEGLTFTEIENNNPSKDTKIYSPLDDYMKNSSIHGIKYTSYKRNRIERTIWAIGLIVSCICCLKLSITILGRFKEGPLLIHLTDKPEPIWNIPFPAITICPNTKSNHLFNFTNAFHSIVSPSDQVDPNEEHLFSQMAHLCDAHLSDQVEFGSERDFVNSSIYSDLRKLAPSMAETLFFCKLRTSTQRCQQFFSHVWTEEGLCFTFNMLNSTELYSSEISPDIPQIVHSFATNETADDLQKYPYQAHSAGVRGGLFVLLKLNERFYDYLCLGPLVGFKVALHQPDEDPFMSMYNFQIPVEYETVVTVKPKVTKISNSLSGYDSTSRNCYLDEEKKLDFFKQYTQRNCEVECFSNFVAKKCGCTKLGLPRNKTTQICGANKIACFERARNELLDSNLRDGPRCNCLPACKSVAYETEIAQNPFHWEKLFEAYKSPLTEFPNASFTRLSIIFKDNHYSATTLHELYSSTEIIALIGGILAIFFGASILSVMEIIYFSIIGLMFYKRK